MLINTNNVYMWPKKWFEKIYCKYIFITHEHVNKTENNGITYQSM